LELATVGIAARIIVDSDEPSRLAVTEAGCQGDDGYQSFQRALCQCIKAEPAHIMPPADQFEKICLERIAKDRWLRE